MKFLNRSLVALVAMALPVAAQAQSSTRYVYCVAQPGESKLYVSDLFSVREGDDWYSQRQAIQSAFRNFLTRDYGWKAGSGVTCHFNESRGTADNNMTATIDHRRNNGWSVSFTNWAY